MTPPTRKPETNYALLTSDPEPRRVLRDRHLRQQPVLSSRGGRHDLIRGQRLPAFGRWPGQRHLVDHDANKNVLGSLQTTPYNAALRLDATCREVHRSRERRIRKLRRNSQQHRDGASAARRPLLANSAGGGYTYLGPSSPGVFTYHYDNARSGVNPMKPR